MADYKLQIVEEPAEGNSSVYKQVQGIPHLEGKGKDKGADNYLCSKNVSSRIVNLKTGETQDQRR